jgi:biotin carboxylase
MNAQPRADTREMLLVGVGCMGRPYVTAARRLGVHVRGIESAGAAGAAAEILDEVHPAAGDFDEPLAAAAYAAAGERAPDAVVAFSEEHVIGAALLQDTLGLPGPSLHAAVLSRNKALQRARFAAEGLPQPAHILVEDLHDAADWSSARFPVVVKPLSSMGSDGVEQVADGGELRRAANQRAHEGPLLVEEVVQGPEYSWEGLIRDGEVWFGNVTTKETSGPPQFVEIAHRAAASLDDDVAEEIDRLVAGVIRALRFRTGLMHLEFRLSDHGPSIMEVAVRTPGGFIMDVIGLTYGVDLFEMTVRAAFGLALPDPPASPIRYAASHWLVAAPGCVTTIEGREEVIAHPAVQRAEIEVAEGDLVGALRSGEGRVGSVVVAADTRSELEQSLAFVRRTLFVHTTPERRLAGHGALVD